MDSGGCKISMQKSENLAEDAATEKFEIHQAEIKGCREFK